MLQGAVSGSSLTPCFPPLSSAEPGEAVLGGEGPKESGHPARNYEARRRMVSFSGLPSGRVQWPSWERLQEVGNHSKNQRFFPSLKIGSIALTRASVNVMSHLG